MEDLKIFEYPAKSFQQPGGPSVHLPNVTLYMSACLCGCQSICLFVVVAVVVFIFIYFFVLPGLLWKLPLVVLLGFLLLFLYEHYSRGSVLRYWYCRRGSIPGNTLSFVFKTHDQQVQLGEWCSVIWPTINGDMLLNRVSYLEQHVQFHY